MIRQFVKPVAAAGRCNRVGMGHIVFAAPGIASFHLHERLRRDLLRRGHRVTVLCTERHDFTFWGEQVGGVDGLRRTRRCDGDLPHEVFERANNASDRRAAQRLVAASQRWFDRERPDLVLFHRHRTATAAILQFVARSIGSRVLWTGDGILPHTMQADERGLDGDASCLRLQASDYRVVTPEPALLDASLASALAGSQPLALPRAEIQMPALGRRVADALADLGDGSVSQAFASLTGWRRAFGPAVGIMPIVPLLDLKPPFVAVLLQDADDQRLQLDAPGHPDHIALVRRAIDVADTFGDETNVVVVLPASIAPTLARLHQLAGERHHRVRIAPTTSAAVVAAAAAVTITVNHPIASVSLLAGTPVVLLGRALFELEGVTTHGSLATLVDDASKTLTSDRSAMRQRLLTWHLRHGHVWCSADLPNHNGMLGLVQAVERRLQGKGHPNAMTYRAGPTWPLAAP